MRRARAENLDIENYYLGHNTYFFVDTVLVDGPHGGHVGVEQLPQRHLLAAGARADQPRLAHRVVAHQHALHQLLNGEDGSLGHVGHRGTSINDVRTRGGSLKSG